MALFPGLEVPLRFDDPPLVDAIKEAGHFRWAPTTSFIKKNKSEPLHGTAFTAVSEYQGYWCSGVGDTDC
ncbi:hypothetical protein J6590_039058 [Homalodisca vitripennis]|nr:hypothetical protein J6590_039058 [Homalodisca vitripennis]